MKVSGPHFSHHVILDELPVPNHGDDGYLKMDQEINENRHRKQSMHNFDDEDEFLDCLSLLNNKVHHLNTLQTLTEFGGGISY